MAWPRHIAFVLILSTSGCSDGGDTDVVEECSVLEDCLEGSGQTCADGRCMCAADDDACVCGFNGHCPSNQVCNLVHKCVDGGRCVEDKDCARGQLCRTTGYNGITNGYCAPTCESDDDCRDGKTCSSRAEGGLICQLSVNNTE